MENKTTYLGLFRHFLVLGLTSFGGSIAHLAYFQKLFVERLDWITQSEFNQFIALGQLLPGPASSQVGMAIGFRLKGFLGSILAWLAFTSPSVALMIAVAIWASAIPPNYALKITAAALILAAVFVTDAVITMAKKKLG